MPFTVKPMAEFVTAGEALTHWMAEQVPVEMRGGHTDPFKIVDHAFQLMEEWKQASINRARAAAENGRPSR